MTEKMITKILRKNTRIVLCGFSQEVIDWAQNHRADMEYLTPDSTFRKREYASSRLFGNQVYRLRQDYGQKDEYVVLPIELDRGIEYRVKGVASNGDFVKGTGINIDLLQRFSSFCGVQFEGQQSDDWWFMFTRAFFDRDGFVFSASQPDAFDVQAIPIRARFKVAKDDA